MIVFSANFIVKPFPNQGWLLNLQFYPINVNVAIFKINDCENFLNPIGSIWQEQASLVTLTSAYNISYVEKKKCKKTR